RPEGSRRWRPRLDRRTRVARVSQETCASFPPRALRDGTWAASEELRRNGRAKVYEGPRKQPQANRSFNRNCESQLLAHRWPEIFLTWPVVARHAGHHFGQIELFPGNFFDQDATSLHRHVHLVTYGYTGILQGFLGETKAQANTPSLCPRR